MKTYKITIKFITDLGTPLHSDTIFGHLCWVYRYKNGEKALSEEILNEYDTSPKVILSDGFPAGYLPFPKLNPISYIELESLYREFFQDSGNRPEKFEFLMLMKQLRKTKWIKLEELEKISQSMNSVELYRLLLGNHITTRGRIHKKAPDKDKHFSFSLIPHNTINRLTGTVEKEGGGFFHTEEIKVRGSEFDIYLKTLLPLTEQDLRELFFFIGDLGYGRDSSIGKGHFVVKNVERFELPEEGNAVISLSHFVPDGSLYDGYYSVETKYGKLGGTYSQGEYAFPKTPILMITPGSVFRIKDKKPYYGQSVGSVHRDINFIRQQTYLFPYFINLRNGKNEK